jgi:two-component system response regulator HydG
MESLFCGHERGAFTGAVGRQTGKFERAQGGTLFLDEMGELSLSIQAKLLRALEDRVIERLGSEKEISLDVRVIAATNRNLRQEAAEGRFREDLYYRIRVLYVRIPPLRERPEDIPALCEYFLSRFVSRRAERPVTGISPQAEEILKRYRWPGNVRELQNIIEEAVVLGSGDVLRPEDLPLDLLSPESTAPRGYYEELDEFKRCLLTNAFEVAGGNSRRAAAFLRIPQKTVYRHLEKLNLTHLRRKDFV